MELSDIPGLGPAKVQKLKDAGIGSVQDLAELDLRRKPDTGIGDEVLKRAKHEARKLLDKEGVPYSKAAYGSNGQAKQDGNGRSTRGKAAGRSTGGTAARASARIETTDAGAEDRSKSVPGGEDAAEDRPKRKGLLARIFGRA